MAEKWMQKASEEMEKKGTKGSFTRSAKRAGESVGKYAEEKKHAKGKLGRRARFALAARKASRGRGR
jgi:hypothetical protein